MEEQKMVIYSDEQDAWQNLSSSGQYRLNNNKRLIRDAVFHISDKHLAKDSGNGAG